MCRVPVGILTSLIATSKRVSRCTVPLRSLYRPLESHWVALCPPPAASASVLFGTAWRARECVCARAHVRTYARAHVFVCVCILFCGYSSDKVC